MRCVYVTTIRRKRIRTFWSMENGKKKVYNAFFEAETNPTGIKLTLMRPDLFFLNEKFNT